jgi:NDP-sugar pyrophosphorylase family protein
MQLVILLGGKASRLKLLTRNKPKSLVKIHGQAFLFYMLLKYKKMGFTEFVFLTRKDKEHSIQYHSLMSSLPNIKYLIVEDNQIDSGTGRGLVDSVENLNDKFWLVNGDSWFENDDSLLSDINKINLENNISVIFTAEPNPGDLANIVFNKITKIVINYKKSGVGSDNKFIYSETTAIDFGLIFLIKKDIELFIKSNTKLNLDMGDIYIWLIRNRKLLSKSTNSKYIDIGSYKGWSLLSTLFSIKI